MRRGGGASGLPGRLETVQKVLTQGMLDRLDRMLDRLDRDAGPGCWTSVLDQTSARARHLCQGDMAV